ncbi:hypothetical protein [Streptomyces sp. NPDC005017]|uniref:hypothetical protein n=1 Tax=Streptomyces sp. NPDC005017 TaxID=3364706 RepID=UPI00368D5AAB
MTVLAMLTVLTALLLAVIGLTLAGGLGYLAYRHPGLRQPIGIALTALGVFTAIVIGLLQSVNP